MILNSSAIKKKNTIQDEDDNYAGRNLSSNITTSTSREMDHVPYFIRDQIIEQIQLSCIW
jgi:hypothetical protein